MQAGKCRIIGGQWRGRKLIIPSLDSVRPTPNRVRETLFNWLAPVISGAYCLDAFAGSGALGFEALSRGAAHVVMIDKEKSIVKLLQDQAELFKITSESSQIYQANLPNQLKKPAHLFNIVFLDPPFQANVLLAMCFYLEDNKFLDENALIYLESGDPIQEDQLPKNWEILKSKQAGQVFYHLARKTDENDRGANAKLASV